MMPASLRIFKWRETTGWIRFKWGDDFAYAFFSVMDELEDSNLSGADKAWKT